MTREQALAILELPRKRAEAAIVALWEKAERWEQIEASSKGMSLAPTTPSGMTPVYLKPSANRRRKKPGRKPGHSGAWRPAPQHIDSTCEHPLKTCPDCG